MCQLIFTNFHNRILNSSYLMLQAWIDAQINNKDGFGVTSDGKIFKTEVSADILVQAFPTINFLSESPVIGHVRQASLANKNIKVDKAHAHPFESDSLILCHNGTLHADFFSKPEFDGLIDSQIFLLFLEEEYKKVKNVPDALVNAYKLFKGKFAFLIYEKSTGHYYAARGNTADLHYRDFILKSKEKAGYILNTSYNDSFKCGVLFQNQAAILGYEFNIIDHLPKNLEANSIFRLRDFEITKVGELKEEAWVEPQRNFTTTLGTKTVTNGATTNFSDVLIDFGLKYRIDLDYIDHIIYKLFGHGLLELSESESDAFIENFIKKLPPVDEALVKAFAEITAKRGTWFIHQTEINIGFPYFLVEDTDAIFKVKDGLNEKNSKNIVQ